MIIIAVAQPAADGHAVEDNASERSFCRPQKLDTAQDVAVGGSRRADNQANGLDILEHEEGVADRMDRGRIEHHAVVVP